MPRKKRRYRVWVMRWPEPSGSEDEFVAFANCMGDTEPGNATFQICNIAGSTPEEAVAALRKFLRKRPVANSADGARAVRSHNLYEPLETWEDIEIEIK